MDLKDLKSAWDTYSSQEVDKHRLGKENIHEMLKSQTKTLVDRIDRNIRIGMGVILAFIAYVVVDTLFLTKLPETIVNQTVEYPKWLVPIDVFSTFLIIMTYLFFVIRYLKVKRSFSIDLQLKDLLKGILDTLQTYKRMFYMAVIILLLNMVVGFAAGLYLGIKIKADALHVAVSNLDSSQIVSAIGIGLLVLIPLIALLFFFLRWGFNKLYGRYLVRLNETLLELDETTDLE
ncbi:MAG: hypothetical protein JZU47_00765 [Prolixibacteraceae bacterium]|nr:hypothetical protein [Prolixibacteraceae bacterium]